MIRYEIDRHDDSFLKDAKINLNTFSFDSKEFKDAVARAITKQEEIDSIPKFRYPAWK